VKKDYSKNNAQEKGEHILDGDAPKTISEMISRTDWILRMKVPKGEKIIFHDEIRGDITFDTNQVTDQVLIKSDGFPTYHFAVVVDDHLMKISQILRAEEWISSTPKHILLYKYFAWEMPPVYHTATLRNPDKSKLSKRHGHTNVVWFQEEGYLPEAVLNFWLFWDGHIPPKRRFFTPGIYFIV
jgi:glutamyl/glutaminyl-tRNA synthetase